MDEIRFVNEYVRNKNTAKEIYKYWCFERPICIFTLTLSAFYFGILLYSLINGFYIDTLSFVLMLFIVAYHPIKYFSYVNQLVKRDAQFGNGKPMNIVASFSNDKIFPYKDDVNDKDHQQYIDISLVKFAYATENYIVLVLKSTRVLLTLKQDSFTKGSVEEFISFLGEKNIKIKAKKNLR